jgi:hypothetical protein
MREIYRVVRERLTQIVWWKGLASSLVKRGQDIDFTLEEGTLLQRSLVWGSLTLGALDFASHYHDLRESVADAIHDEKTFSDWAIAEFHKITHSEHAREIYRRTSSRDLNRLQRIASNFDRVSGSRVSPDEIRHSRRRSPRSCRTCAGKSK